MRWLLLAFVAGVTAVSNISWKIHEKRSELPSGWTRARKHVSTSIIPLRIALTQPTSFEEIDSYLNDVSHPDSPNYSQHWTADQVAEKFAPANDTIDAVRAWLMASGIDSNRIQLSPGKGWMHVANSTTAEAEKLLRAEYYVYIHDTGVEHVATESYHLPSHMTTHVDFVMPTIHFDAKVPRKNEPATNGLLSKARRSASSWCAQLTPACLQAIYGIPNKPGAVSKNSFGIVEYTPHAYHQKDLDMFAKTLSPKLVGKSPKQISIDGGFQQTKLNGSSYNFESSIDLTYGMALVGPEQPVTLYQVGDMVQTSNFNSFLDAIDSFYCIFENGDASTDAHFPDPKPGGYKGPKACGTVKPTNVIATSYLIDEASSSNLYLGRQCLEYGKLGIMGVTVLYPTGDHGVEGNSGCLTNNDSKTKIFNPAFPATCPFVTAVGGTQLVGGTTREVAWSGSGGGWSNQFGLPAYQSNAVKSYMKHHQHGYSAEIWNSTGKSRAIPDIAVAAANYWFALNGKWIMQDGGTSTSVPVLGAIITLVNDARIKAGKRPVGFINPAIYSKGFENAFNDITSGNNPGCKTKGFKTAAGWDPVTGVGTPKFKQLVEAWLKLR
ncbi:peptidase S8/S53 domain-containing protein [Hygrophoropsis aurantiaca]|uniref:Peptidase S8/S53 domain-containing protein n=1 Tax=Hygrophoropsis aurantiaca TaxID=72124 RepID=A0ACB8AKU4_9AGAM|nr:peptidase S8/S53 domain-containing protein [Hygrophoropsis aurantiaca]